MKIEKWKIIIIWVLALIPMILTIVFYEKLPQKIPMHWNMEGQVDRMSDKFPGAFILPLIILAMPVLMGVLPRIDPKRANYKLFGNSYYAIRLCTVVVLVCINLYMLFTSLGYSMFRMDTFIKIMVGVLIAVLGNVMPKLKQNYFAGIKTPWTLASEEVWFAVHRITGMLWFAAGILMVILGLIPGIVPVIAYIAIIPVIGIYPIVYSYFVFKRLSE
ncbi:MAG TPA: SdpI family protein [Pseudobacteroides sp.]|uniref:SdpI family protein n=1 Tax=Pseudobacteroides sp. TaxID=1968840 RepID=UPI002F93775D